MALGERRARPSRLIVAVLLLLATVAVGGYFWWWYSGTPLDLGSEPKAQVKAIENDTISALIRQLDSSDAATLAAAENALVEIGPQSAPYLIKCLKEGNYAVRLRAARILEKMGSGIKNFVPDLARALRDCPIRGVKQLVDTETRHQCLWAPVD